MRISFTSFLLWDFRRNEAKPNQGLTARAGQGRIKKKAPSSAGVKLGKQEFAKLESHIREYLPMKKRKAGETEVFMGAYRYSVELDRDGLIMRVLKKEKVYIKH